MHCLQVRCDALPTSTPRAAVAPPPLPAAASAPGALVSSAAVATGTGHPTVIGVTELLRALRLMGFHDYEDAVAIAVAHTGMLDTGIPDSIMFDLLSAPEVGIEASYALEIAEFVKNCGLSTGPGTPAAAASGSNDAADKPVCYSLTATSLFRFSTASRRWLPCPCVQSRLCSPEFVCMYFQYR